jgi:hypothetical protein
LESDEKKDIAPAARKKIKAASRKYRNLLAKTIFRLYEEIFLAE